MPVLWKIGGECGFLALPPQLSYRALPPPDALIRSKSRATSRPGVLSLGWTLLCVGAVAFGGLGATLALLRRELVERRGWLRSSDVTEALVYTKRCPVRPWCRSSPFLDGG
jgi:hypothetical protein